MTQITEAGIYPDFPELLYHADPCVEPSLSQSIGKTLILKTARHCWLAHPKLNPNFKPIHKKDFDIGKAAHRWLLEGKTGFVTVDAKAFNTNAAKATRDAAYMKSKIPVLKHKIPEIQDMVAAARMQIRGNDEIPHILDTHSVEQTLIWEEETSDGKVWCRSRPDLSPQKGTVLGEYKTTTDASPSGWRNRVFDLGFDIQSGFYRRAARALLGIEDAVVKFIVQETSAPYALSIISLEPEAIVIGDEKVEMMINKWAWCRKHDKWPGYLNTTVYIGPPPWEVTKWELIKRLPDMYGIDDKDWHKMMTDWQSPVEEGKPKEALPE